MVLPSSLRLTASAVTIPNRRTTYTITWHLIATVAQHLESEIVAQRQRLEELKTDHSETSADRREATKARAEVECLVRDAELSGRESSPYPANFSCTPAWILMATPLR